MHMLKSIALSISFLIDAPTPSIGPLLCWYMLICLLAFGKNSHNSRCTCYYTARVKSNSIINLIFDWCPNSIHRTFAVSRFCDYPYDSRIMLDGKFFCQISIIFVMVLTSWTVSDNVKNLQPIPVKTAKDLL